MAKSSKRNVRKPAVQETTRRTAGNKDVKKPSSRQKRAGGENRSRSASAKEGGARRSAASRSSGDRMFNKRGSARDLERDMAERESLLETSLEQVYSVRSEALREGIKLPVIFLVDCEDEIGGRLAREWAGAAAVADAIEESRAEDKALTTTFAQPLSFRDCQLYVPQMFPYLAQTFEQAPPEGTFVAVVVAAGGAGSFYVPLNE